MAENTTLTVLTVDDNDAIRYWLTRCLRDGGYRVIEARTGTEALSLAQQDLALITLDINLPDMDGFEVCRRLKENPGTSGIPVLHISASCVGSEHRVRGLDGGADAYLSEPIDHQVLLSTVNALLRLSQAQKESRRQAAEAERTREELAKSYESLESRVKERTAELEHRSLEVHTLSQRLLQAQDEERRRISRELHDSTGQLLVGLTLNLSELHRELGRATPKAQRLVDDASSMVDEISRQIRTLSYLLHPPLLDLVGLTSALKWYVDGFICRSNIQVTLDLPDDTERLSQDLETTIYRLIQECLTNVHRHSGSKTASIRVVKDDHEVRLEVTDEGNGLVPRTESAAEEVRPGVGILGMKERVRQFGGVLEVSSRRSGMSVRATLPITTQASVHTP